jgi:hypothetical protein
MENEMKDIVLPPEFSGAGQLILYTRYGDPRELGWENKWITTWNVQEAFPWFPQKKLAVHKHFQPVLEAAFKELTDLDLHKEIKSVGDCYNLRNATGSNQVLSVHSWGAGIDFNLEENPVGAEGAWSKQFIEVMEKHKIHCGQCWTGRKEPKHFAMVNG